MSGLKASPVTCRINPSMSQFCHPSLNFPSAIRTNDMPVVCSSLPVAGKPRPSSCMPRRIRPAKTYAVGFGNSVVEGDLDIRERRLHAIEERTETFGTPGSLRHFRKSRRWVQGVLGSLTGAFYSTLPQTTVSTGPYSLGTQGHLREWVHGNRSRWAQGADGVTRVSVWRVQARQANSRCSL